jgi:hypothetical protein
MTQKISVFGENWRAHAEYRYVRGKFLFSFLFNILNIFPIAGAYTPTL